MIEKDFTPTKETISLHGLGFIQLKLEGNQRLHVWHPELPTRACFVDSSTHNHRFSFQSRVLKGIQLNELVEVIPCDSGTHEIISHDGPRSEKGGRESFVAGQCRVRYLGEHRYEPGEMYFMPELAYHHTPNDGIVITVMQKLYEGTVHANTIITKGKTFDQQFDRFQLSPEQLYEYVVDAFRH